MSALTCGVNATPLIRRSASHSYTTPKTAQECWESITVRRTTNRSSSHRSFPFWVIVGITIPDIVLSDLSVNINYSLFSVSYSLHGEMDTYMHHTSVESVTWKAVEASASTTHACVLKVSTFFFPPPKGHSAPYPPQAPVRNPKTAFTPTERGEKQRSLNLLVSHAFSALSTFV